MKNFKASMYYSFDKAFGLLKISIFFSSYKSLITFKGFKLRKLFTPTSQQARGFARLEL
jgi:hypothetical protein